MLLGICNLHLNSFNCITVCINIFIDNLILEERSQVIDFTIPVYTLTGRLITAAPQKTTDMMSFLKVLGLEYSLAMLSVIFVLITVMVLIRSGSFIQRIVEVTGTVLSAQMALSIDNQSAMEWSRRILLLAVCLFGGMNWYVYNAGLISTLTAKNAEPWPIQTFDDILEKQYQVLLPKGTSNIEIWKNGPFTKEIYEKTIKDNPDALYEDKSEALKLILSGGKYVGVGDEEQLLLSSSCKTGAYKGLGFKSQISFGFPRESPMIDLFNHHLLKMKTSGMLSKIFSAVPKVTQSCEENDSISIISYSNVSFLFLVLAGGAFLSILCLMIEITLKRFARPRF